MKIERIKTELEKARQRAAQWQAREKDLERQLAEQENLEIIQAVRSITASPEELGGILEKIRSMKPSAELSQESRVNGNREETDQHEEQNL